MRRGRNLLLTVFCAATLTGAMTLVGGAQAGASGIIDLSTPAAIKQYLISIGVNPATAVWQQSLKNYAGPSCPGSGWNCVGTKAPVVQLAPPGGTNIFDCLGKKCLVVQSTPRSGQNSADCKRTGQDTSQSCSITQNNTKGTNSTNSANIEQNITESQGCTQAATEAASILQQNASGANHATIGQRVTQSSKSAGGACGTQDQEAHQGATVSQTTTAGGNNSSDIDQSQKQSETASGGSAITQEQNATATSPPDCTSSQNASKNQCAEVSQTSNTGDQDSTLTQGINQNATASNTVNLTQTQGTLEGGNGGTVDQTSAGVSTSHADQTVNHTVSHTGVTGVAVRSQETGDPRCCQMQSGNSDDQAFITQTTDQSSSPTGAAQNAFLEGNCVSDGTCDVNQSATLDHAQDTNSCTGTGADCAFVILECGSADGEGGCGGGG